VIERLVARGRDEGALRDDVVPEDVTVLLWATARVIERTADVAPDQVHRFLAMHLDGLRPGAATARPGARPLTSRQLQRALRGDTARRRSAE
jgi:hypothetical protein